MASPIVIRADWFRLARLAILLLAATSGLGVLYQVIRRLCHKTKQLVWKSVMRNPSSDKQEAKAITALVAVKAVSTVAAEVAKLNQALLALQSEGRHRALNIFRCLQAHSSSITEAEQMARDIVEDLCRTKQVSAKHDEPGIITKPSAESHVSHSPSFLEVMNMLERGETPPGIKVINDKPPIPNHAPSVSRLAPKPKPWEKVPKPKSNLVHGVP